MPTFQYTAKKGLGKIVHGTIEADHVDAAINRILQQGMTPVDVQSKAGSHGTTMTKPFSKKKLLPRKVRPWEVAVFTRQLADLIEAGVPVLQALKVVLPQIKNPAFLPVAGQIHDAVRDGASLSEALGQFPHIFSKIYVNMVHAGEVGGNLSRTLSRLADLQEQDFETRAQVQSSLIYPAVILAVAMVTIFILLTFVIPKIVVIFEDLQQDLPLSTRLIIAASDFCRGFWWLILGVLIGAGVYIRRVRHTETARIWIDQNILRVPVLGDFIKTAEIGRFARHLGALLENGVVIVPALESVGLLMENEIMRQEVRRMTRDVTNGARLTAVLRESPFFPPAVVSMVSVGEEAGQLHRGLYKLADYYERQTDRFVKRVLSLIEPVLILSLGGFVGFIFLGLLLPILKMNLVIK